MKKLNRRQLLQHSYRYGLGLTALGVLPTFLAGCGPSNSNASTSTSKTGTDLASFLARAGKPYKGINLNVLAISSAQAAAAQSVIADFTSATGINVSFTSLSENETITKAQITLSSHAPGFDILQAESFFIPLYAQNHWLEPIDHLMHDKALTYPGLRLSAYAPSALNQLTGQGNLYALPMFIATQVFYYRTDIFHQHGITPPTTFAQLQSVCQKINGKPLPAIALRSGIGPTENVFDWTAWLYAFGGRFFKSFDPTTGKYGPPDLDSPQAIQSAQFYASILQHYAPSGSLSWQVADVVRAFESGQVAMMQEGSPFGGTLNDPAQSRVAGKVGAFPIPAGPSGQFFPSAAQGWAINRYSRHPEAAWLFTQWATDPGTMLKACLVSPFSSPPIPAIFENPKFVKKYQFTGFLPSVNTSLKGKASPDQGSYIPGLVDWNSVGQAVSTYLNEIITGQVSAAKGMKAANTEVNAILTRSGYYS